MPEVADYELRRQLLLNGNAAGVRRLDLLGQAVRFEPVGPGTFRRVAEIWADVRRRGLPTADPLSLDGDCLLAARAILLGEREGVGPVVVATTNVGYLARLTGIDARPWDAVVP